DLRVLVLARADHHVGARVEPGQEALHFVERRGEVGVEEEDRVAARREHAAAHRRALPAVDVAAQHHDRDVAAHLLGDRDATIAAAVVAHDDFVVAGREGGEVAPDRRECVAQSSLLVEDRDDDAEQGGRAALWEGKRPGSLPGPSPLRATEPPLLNSGPAAPARARVSFLLLLALLAAMSALL